MFQAVLAKIGAALMAPLVLISGVFTQTRDIPITPPPPVALIAIAETTSSSPVQVPEGNPSGQAEASSTTERPSLMPGLLPVVKLRSQKIIAKAGIGATSLPPSSAPAVSAPKTAPLPKTITAQWVLDHTALSLNQKIDGSYWASFSTNLGIRGNFNWGLGQTTVGNGSLPPFNLDYYCSPSPSIPDVGTGDLNPSFEVRTAYVCSLTLSGTGGTATKEFDFKTGGGRLLVNLASGMDTLLKDERDTAGLTFTNQDANPVAVTGLAFDISYSSLSTSSSPLILRFADPITDASLFDYHLENLPADPVKPYTWSQTGVQAQFSLSINGQNSNGVFVEALGVHKFVFSGVNPEIKVVVRSVATDRSDIKILGSPIIDWTCVPSNQPYNPYSTSSPAALGQTCSQ